jgi:hypothetical protein
MSTPFDRAAADEESNKNGNTSNREDMLNIQSMLSDQTEVLKDISWTVEVMKARLIAVEREVRDLKMTARQEAMTTRKAVSDLTTSVDCLKYGLVVTTASHGQVHYTPRKI